MSLFEVQQYEMFEMLQKQQEQLHQFWVYSRDRDRALKKSLQRNFSKPMATFPIFPEALILQSQGSDINAEASEQVVDEDTTAGVQQEEPPAAVVADVPEPSSSGGKKKGKAMVKDSPPRRHSMRNPLNWKWNS